MVNLNKVRSFRKRLEIIREREIEQASKDKLDLIEVIDSDNGVAKFFIYSEPNEKSKGPKLWSRLFRTRSRNW